MILRNVMNDSVNLRHGKTRCHTNENFQTKYYFVTRTLSIWIGRCYFSFFSASLIENLWILERQYGCQLLSNDMSIMYLMAIKVDITQTILIEITNIWLKIIKIKQLFVEDIDV